MAFLADPPKNLCMKGLKRFYPDVNKELETIAIIDELKPNPEEDVVIEKHWFDAFTDTSLDNFLKALNKKQLIITGTLTDACVNATTIGAYHKNYYNVVVTDAVAALVPEQHEWTLKLLAKRYAKLMTTSEVISVLDK